MKKEELVKLLRDIAKDLEAIELPKDTDALAMQKLEDLKAKFVTFKSELNAMPAAIRKEYQEFVVFLFESLENALKSLIDQWKAHAKGNDLHEQLFTLTIGMSINALQSAIRISVLWLKHLANVIELESVVKSEEEKK